MANLIPDTINWADYERSTEPRTKVHAASKFADELVASFAPRPVQTHRPEMFSTKLRDKIEFRPGEVTVWAGYNGHRKSMFTGQVALDLIVQRQRTLIASMEMYPTQTLKRMAQQCYGSSAISDDWARRFAKWTDGRLWLFDHFGRARPDVVVAVLRYFAEELQGKQAFIDSMMMVCASEESMDEQKQFMTDIVRTAQETGLHLHLIAHCRKPQAGGEDKPPTKYDLRGSAAISDQAHNVVTVFANRAKKSGLGEHQTMDAPDQLVSVEKQRNGEWEGRASLWFHKPSLRFTDQPVEHVNPYEIEV